MEFLRCAEGATKILHFLDVLVEFTVLFNASAVGASKNSKFSLGGVAPQITRFACGPETLVSSSLLVNPGLNIYVGFCAI